MRPDVTIISPLSAAEALDRLRARGREWKESTVPPALRDAGVLRIDVTVGRDRFTMSVSARAARAWVGWTGVVTEVHGESGSRLLVRRYTNGCTPLVAGGLIVAITAFQLYRGADWPDVAIATGVLTVGATIMYSFQEMMTRDLRQSLFGLLLATVDATRYTRTSDPSVSTPQ